MDKKIILADFQAALLQLESALELDAINDVLKAGCIQYFEFSFELAWKTIKTIANEQGAQECNSPKSALKFAFKNGWLLEEDIWLDMLKSRNRMSHTYNAKNALAIYTKLPDYLIALNALKNELTQTE